MALSDALPIGRRREPAWFLLLLAMAGLSSVTFACVTPFAAFAVLTAATVRRPVALCTMAATWLVNQLIGYTALGYPLDGATLAWGVAIGAAALAAAFAAGLILSRPSPVRLATAFIAALATFEGALYLVSLLLGGSANFAPVIVAQVALANAAWLVGIAALGIALTRLAAIPRRVAPRVTT